MTVVRLYMVMNLWVWIWVAISIIFEVAGDYFVKTAANSAGMKSFAMWMACFLSYNLMLIAWMVAIHDAKQITIPGIVWLLCGQLALVALGIGLFGEQASIAQKVGIGLSAMALILLSL